MASLYTKLVSSLVFPVHEMLKGHNTVEIRKELEETQWLDPSELTRYQMQRLGGFLSEIKNNVPYYRKIFTDIGEVEIRGNEMSVLQSLPFLTKPLIRANYETLQSDRAEGLSEFNTGGSSGEPLVFLIGKERISHDVAAKWRVTRWWDVDIGDPEIVVWGSPIELGSQDRIKLLRDKILRTKLLPAFEMSESNLAQFVISIRQYKPRMVFGYPSSLSYIAQYAEKRRIKLNDIGIKVAFVTSEKLYQHQREIIERVLGCPVANGYGGRDAGFIAHECPQGRLHITAEDIIVEIVDENGSSLPEGQAGEIVITHMATKDFPFVRYKTGDVGILSKEHCECGRGLPVLADIQGRSTDFIVAEDGTVMHGLALIYVIRENPGIEHFKIIQESKTFTKIQYVPNDRFDVNKIDVMSEDLKRRLGEGVEIQWEKVEVMPREKSGKYRFVVSKVKI